MPLTLLAGPCVIESEELIFETAKQLKDITSKLNIEFYFKASFDKANRTSINSYRGPGMKKGLEILDKVKTKLNLRIVTDIHESYQADPVAQVADIIQIPAFLCRQTDLLVAAAKTGKLINVKKAQFLSAQDMKHVVTKLEESNCKNIWLCERGTFFGYNRLVVDMPGMVEMQKYGYPVVFDATHSVQKPGGAGVSSSGNREYISYLSKAAAAMGIDHFFMEVHPSPDYALSDGPNMLPVSEVESLLTMLSKINTITQE